MNANELADRLETEDCCTIDMENVADMLRQQQETIEHQNEEYLALARFQKSLQEQNNQQQKENDEMLEGIKQIRYWLESTCEDGFADEIFRCFPVWLLRKAQEK